MEDKNLVLYGQSTTGKGGDGGQEGWEGTCYFYAQSTAGKGGYGGQALGSLRHQPQEKEEMEDKHLVNAIL